MPDSCTHVYVHYVWTTWSRKPLISAELRRRIYACIAAKCEELRCELLEIGGTEDHVHVLARVHSLVSVAELAKGMKGASSHLVNHDLAPDGFFRWQGNYGAFSISEREIGPVRDYIRRQEEHHANDLLRPEWEQILEIRPPLAPADPPRLLNAPSLTQETAV
jgi:REP-associated tyrosine transposase